MKIQPSFQNRYQDRFYTTVTDPWKITLDSELILANWKLKIKLNKLY